MKLQGVSVLFALIVLPLILVLSYYIKLQVKTIGLQNQYDVKLLNSTRDALSAFEINTANEDLSTVSDSLRTIIEASSNVFINTLSTNLGMSNASKSYIEPYVPALLYTLYDGYYIYAPTRVPTVLTDADGNAVAVGDPGVTKNGDTYAYKIAHATEDSEKECQVCANPDSDEHIRASEYSNKDNYMRYSSISTDLAMQNDYGQILYEKKKANPTDPSVYTTKIEDAELKTKNVLKSYMPYSARYKRDGEFDITVVYTLDNYITIEGTVGNVYYTKSGYLLPKDCYFAGAGNENLAELKKYSQEDARKIIKSGKTLSLKLADNKTNELDNDGKPKELKELDETYCTVITSGGSGSYDELSEKVTILNNRIDNAQYYKRAIEVGAMATSAEEIVKFIVDAGKTHDVSTAEDTLVKIEEESVVEANRLQYELDKMSAMVYYVEGIIFTEWVQNTLGDVQEKDLIEVAGQEYRTVNGNELLTYKFDTEEPIFYIEGSIKKGVTDIPEDSVFYTHKLNVIRNSIQYNLNLAMSTYNNMTTGQSSYAMPVMETEEWQKILTNPSIVSFLQGYHCGLKTYSNYMIVSSTNNEISIPTEEIYYIDKEKFSNEISEYHKINCPKLASTNGEFLSFTSKEAKYDKIYNKHNSLLSYRYDHKNYACYDCINDGNYVENEIFLKKNGPYKKLDENGDYQTITVSDEEQEKAKIAVKAYYIGVGKCKNNLYKMNAVKSPEGYEVIIDNTAGIATSSSLSMSKVKAIEIIIGTIKTTNPQESALQYKVKSGSEYITDQIYSFSSNVTTNNTILINVDPIKAASSSEAVIQSNLSTLNFENQAAETTAYFDLSTDSDGDGVMDKNFDGDAVFKKAIKYVRIIYK